MFIYCKNEKTYETDQIMFTNADCLRFINKETGEKEEINQEEILFISSPEEEPEPLRIAIDLEGGLIPAVYSKTPLEAIVLDTDCEGVEENELIVLYEQEIYPSTRTADIRPKIIDDAFRLFEEGEKANQKTEEGKD